MTGLGVFEYVKLAIFFASWLYVPVAPVCVWLIVKRKGAFRAGAALFLLCISCLAYARFVEPRILLTAEHEITLKRCGASSGAARVAVFSDTHNGLFGNAMPIDRIARRVDAANADFVLIPGDFIYFLDPEKYPETYAALEIIRAPMFAVLGNHDLGLPGPDFRVALSKALPHAGVRLIDDQALRLSNSKFTIELVALSDQWDHRQKLSLLMAPPSAPRLVLTHNPATMKDFRPGRTADLLVGGHTHGGQIQLPFLTCAMTGVCGDAAYGLRSVGDVEVFTTSGTGMVGLPMRFRVPPRIDILNIHYPSCAETGNSF